LLSGEVDLIFISFSFSDAEFIAGAVNCGGRQLLEELYPDFPR
jgi:hypothetical protein